MPLPRFQFSPAARFTFALIAAATIGFLIELGTMRENSQKELRKTVAAMTDLRYAAEAERFFLPDDFVRAGQVLRREREKMMPRFEPLLRAVAQRGPDALDEEALRRRVNRLSESQRIAMLLLFFLPDQTPGNISLKSGDSITVAAKILNEKNAAAIRRIANDSALLQAIKNQKPPRADLNFGDDDNRRILYYAIQGRLLSGSEIEFRKFAAEFAEDPPVKPLTFARQLALSKELEFMFLIGRGEKAQPRAEQLLDGYFIRNSILRGRLEHRIDVYTAKKTK